ncbi:MAG: methyltransferase domain-containing protein [Gammaproteobacteria bacterium]|nr:methyltransferase domain-containing protein [Gammaproteobacteria bacterium]MBU1646891.1 methyltransferase domain-containing protein [Gammaproteobacteria bacterium]MBU1971152.1 methyltransferase domain-containing protein [Gammaproteobacteria bacterium]
MSHSIAHRFGRAAASYDAHSAPQRHAAQRLADLIAAESLPAHPRVLEIGCGTGHLTVALAEALLRRAASAEFFCSDIAPAMVAACRARLPQPHYLVMDGERPAVRGGFDIVCANLAAQWFHDLPGTLARLSELLAPGGLLAISTLGAESFGEWKSVHAALGLRAGTLPFVTTTALRNAFPGGELVIDEEVFVDRADAALELPRRLRAIGATRPVPGHRPLTAGQLRRVLRALGPAPTLSYQLLYGRFRKATA